MMRGALKPRPQDVEAELREANQTAKALNVVAVEQVHTHSSPKGLLSGKGQGLPTARPEGGGAGEPWRGRWRDIHCLFSAFCILSFSFSCGVSLGWGGGEEAGDRVGVPELPQPTSSKSLGLAGACVEDGQAVETGHEGLGAPVDS